MNFQLIPFLFILSNVLVIISGQSQFQQPISFDPGFGGLHAKDVIFNAMKTIDTSKDDKENYQMFTVMLSTMHSRTFVKDKECTDVNKDEADSFCKTHVGGYEKGKSGTTTEGTKPMEGKLMNKGNVATDTIQLHKDGLKIVDQKFGVMDYLVAEDADFWGIQRKPKDGEKPGQIIKQNLAFGCLSLWPGAPEDTDNFGEKSPLQTLIEQKPSAKNSQQQIPQELVTIRMDKSEEMTDSKTNGHLLVGSLDGLCESWKKLQTPTDEKQAPWTLKIDEFEGVVGTKDVMAVIDTTSEQITLPKAASEAHGQIKDANCETKDLKPLKFTIGGLVYSVPASHYMKKTTEKAQDGTETTKCVSLVAQNSDDNDQKIHLGLPFLRSSCVALDLKTKAVWLSGGQCKNTAAPSPGKPDDGGKTENGAAIPAGIVSSLGMTLASFVFLAVPALLIH